MSEVSAEPRSELMAISNAMVALHKEQFGRGPTKARSDFAGPDSLVCVLSDVLLPAELKLIHMGNAERVVDSRTSFQAATRDDFIAAIEGIVFRTVIAFASGIDPENNTVFETFTFAPRGLAHNGTDGAGAS